MQVWKDAEIDPAPLRGKCVAVLGFGSQGRAQACNLHDAGCDVVVALRADSASRPAAHACGLAVATPTEAAARADVLMFLIPDEEIPAAYAAVAAALRPGTYLGFAHGFALHYRTITPRVDLNAFLVAPKGIGPQVRSQYTAGRGVPGLVAVHQDPSGDTLGVALAYAAAIGCGRIGVLPTTIAEETETDLFSEQAVLCGGLTHLIQAAFETLVEAGYSEEAAYFECLHEVKLIADLLHERGIAGMRAAISNTAKFGDITRGPRVVGPAVKAALGEILAEIRSGEFAREWQAEHAAGQARLRAALAAQAEHPIETVGARLRKLWQGATR